MSTSLKSEMALIAAAHKANVEFAQRKQSDAEEILAFTVAPVLREFVDAAKAQTSGKWAVEQREGGGIVIANSVKNAEVHAFARKGKIVLDLRLRVGRLAEFDADSPSLVGEVRRALLEWYASAFQDETLAIA